MTEPIEVAMTEPIEVAMTEPIEVAMTEPITEGFVALADIQVKVWKQTNEPIFERDVLGIIFPDGKFSPVRPIDTFWVFPPEAVSNVRRQIVLNPPVVQYQGSPPENGEAAAHFLADVLRIAPLSDRSDVGAFYADLIKQLEAQYGNH